MFLSKTWAAPEISRPGCIWTHSLFISFTELAQIEDPRILLQLFVRPTDDRRKQIGTLHRWHWIW